VETSSFELAVVENCFYCQNYSTVTQNDAVEKLIYGTTLVV